MNKMKYVLDKQQLLDFMKGITNPGLKKKNMLDKIHIPVFNKKITIESYAWMVWGELLKDENVMGTAIDKYEWGNLFKDVTEDTEFVERLFKQINRKSKCINYPEFLQYILLLDDTDLKIFTLCLKEPMIYNPLVDVDFNDSVIIDIKDPNSPINTKPKTSSKKSKPNKPITKQPTIKPPTTNKPTITSPRAPSPPHKSFDRVDKETNTASFPDKKPSCEDFCNRLTLLWLDMKLMFITTKNKIINSLYGLR